MSTLCVHPLCPSQLYDRWENVVILLVVIKLTSDKKYVHRY